ncbi:MAG: aminotransferase class V-fold PLP-dependent enzyme [Enterobacteriaceae bacterium]
MKNKIRNDFPFFKNTKNKVIYFDNAASTHKPKSVIESKLNFYSKKYSSIHRGSYDLSNEITVKVEKIRKKIAKFINAKSFKEIIFTKNTTEGINLVANWICNIIKKKENIVISIMEHHSNIIPWQIVSIKKNLKLKYIPLLKNGNLNLNLINKIVNENTKVFSITHLSNVLGIVNPIKKIVKIVRKLSNAIIIIDGAQYVAHNVLDVSKIDCDFYVFSGHKMYGPTGIGVLYGKKKILENVDPLIFGGGIVNDLNIVKKKIKICDIPWKLEAGTPNISGIIGLGAAINYINKIKISNIVCYETKLVSYLFKKLKEIKGIIIYGSELRSGIISFNIKNLHSYDVGSFLNQYGIYIRTGYHCAIPLIRHFNVSGMCRISLAIYNNLDEINYLIKKINKIKKLLY